MIKEGHVPGGTRSNQVYLEPDVEIKGNYDSELITLLHDAQTSGGLLISVEEKKLKLLIEELKKRGIETIAVIGEVTKSHPGKIFII